MQFIMGRSILPMDQWVGGTPQLELFLFGHREGY